VNFGDLSEQQKRVLEFARENGYVVPYSPAHASKCATTQGGLVRTVRSLRLHELLRLGAAGRCHLTERGEELVPARGLTEKWWDR
jgi:hypothetical protein